MLKKSWPKNISETLHYRFGEKPLHEYLMDHAIDRSDQTAYIFYGNHITWKQLYDHTSRLAHFLKNQGITKGDRIALFMQNCPQYLIGHYAIQMLGAVVVPLNPMYKESEQIGRASCRVRGYRTEGVCAMMCKDNRATGA